MGFYQFGQRISRLVCRQSRLQRPDIHIPLGSIATNSPPGYLNGVFVRFKWTDEEDPKAFFEFRINVDELTSNVTLEITDFTLPEEKQECVDLWNEQISTLRRKLGS